MASEGTTSLSDGRRLAWAEFGDPQGRPLLFFPGWPGSRLYGRQLETAATDLGFRVIATDRPGIGRSDYKPGRTVVDTADDITQLADSLSLERFDVVGSAEGTQYALACAWKYADRLTGVALVNPATPRDPEPQGGAPASPMKRVLRWAAQTPSAGRIVMTLVAKGAQRSPGFILKQMEGNASGDDRAILANPEVRDLITSTAADAFKPGARGPAHEMGLTTGPWSIPVEDISVHVEVWQGEEDRLAPMDRTKSLVDAVPRSELHLVPGAGHLWLFERADIVVRGLLKAG